MAEPDLQRELPAKEIEAMIRLVEPEWRLQHAQFMEDGVTAIYRVVVDTGDGQRECYLKATPLTADAAYEPMVDTEARLTAAVGRHTDIPVPRILGAVDAHDEVRTPFFLMEAMPGVDDGMDILFELSEETMASLARDTGRYLGQLHDLETPNLRRFGDDFTHDSETTLQGEPPRGNLTEFTFSEGYDSWNERLHEWIAEDLEQLAATDRFADLHDPIEETLMELVDDLPEPDEPVLCRIDHGFWNVLTDESHSEYTAWLDWGSLFAGPPGFDLATVGYYLCGGPWMTLHDVADFQTTIRQSLVDGYRKHRPVPPKYDHKRRCYQLDAIVLTLVGLDADERKPRHIPPERVDEAAAGMREMVQELR